MKKIIVILIFSLCIFGCEKKEKEPINNEPIIEENNSNDSNKNDIKEENPIKIGIYKNNKLVKNYDTHFNDYTDIAVFNIFYTNDEVLDNLSVKENYKKYYNQYKDIKKYKTGFYITFKTENKTYEQTYLDSSKTHDIWLLYVYLYDDVNRDDNTFYSHIEPKDENENTIFSSIKLYTYMYSDAIISPITLTAFTYKGPEDFDENNHYIGNSSYTITINNVN